jgi:hypothetical protein
MTWGITIRPATQAEIDHLGADASVEDGAAAVRVTGVDGYPDQLVAVLNEYCTAFVNPALITGHLNLGGPHCPPPTREDVEHVVDVATSFVAFIVGVDHGE